MEKLNSCYEYYNKLWIWRGKMWFVAHIADNFVELSRIVPNTHRYEMAESFPLSVLDELQPPPPDLEAKMFLLE
jgi:hypothetical protein